ncbi:MAG: helix-turn-helix domain-containing protein, partial [Pyrinomonadaceae bacterium]
IQIPPLRGRAEDILPLAEHFLARSAGRASKPLRGLSEAARKTLLAYHWPGNVRELENVIERAVVIAPDAEITRRCLPAEITDPQKSLAAVQSTIGAGAGVDFARGVNFYDEVRRFEIDLIRRALEQTGGHQSRAARLLGMNATTLNSKIKTYNIQLRS